MLNARNLIFILFFLVAVTIASFLGFKLYLDHEVKQRVDDVIKSLWSFAKVEYGNLSISLKGDVVLSNLTIRPFEVDDVFRINSIELSIPDLEFWLDAEKALAEGNIPERATLRVKNVVIPTNGPLMSGLRQQWRETYGADSLCLNDDARHLVLADLGFDELHMDSEVSYTFNKASSALSLTGSYDDKELSRYDFNVNLQLPSKSDLAAKHFGNFRIGKANFNYSDIGFNKKYLARCAARLGISQDQYVELKAQQPGAFSIPGLVMGSGLRAGYKESLRPEGTYNVAINPAAPVNPLSLLFYDAKDIVNSLNLAVNVNGEPVPDLSISFQSAELTSKEAQKPLANSLPSLKSLAAKVLGDDAIKDESKAAQKGQKEHVIRYVPIAIADLPRKQGSRVRLVTTSDFVRIGRVDGVALGEVTISWPVGRGEMAANVSIHRIKKVELIIEE